MEIEERKSNIPSPPYRRRSEASTYLRDKYGLRYAPTTLAKLASIGGGPSFIYSGFFPIYPEASLDQWALARISPLRRSTSDHGSAADRRTKNGAASEPNARSFEPPTPPPSEISMVEREGEDIRAESGGFSNRKPAPTGAEVGR